MAIGRETARAVHRHPLSGLIRVFLSRSHRRKIPEWRFPTFTAISSRPASSSC
jgi:hypothetical protein